MHTLDLAAAGLLLAGALPSFVPTQITVDLPAPSPQAVVDLRTAEGAALVKAEWRYRDVSIVDVDHREPGPDLRPSGAPNHTKDIAPHAGAADFDDSDWRAIDPAALEQRRSHGRLAFNWYRTRITLPEHVGDFDVRGATVVLELVLDDYAEIWVDGRLPIVLGQAGGQLVAGFNAPNRVVLTSDARPGQQIQLAIFGANGPISNPPANYIWVRSATLDFYARGGLSAGDTAQAEIVRLDPALDRIVAPGAVMEKLAGGFQFTEGPVWHPDGYLLFSDPNANMIYRWSPEGPVSVFRTKSGYTGFDIGRYRQPGSNGLTLDREGLLVINEHGNRRVTRLERTGKVTVIADGYKGKRLNSPNDLVYRSDGTLYFTDPPFGLPNFFDDARQELPYSGVYSWRDGKLRLEASELTGPNGVAFSPDERFLYVTNWDTAHKVVMRYPVAADGRLGAGEVLFDLTGAPGEEALDGVKVDQAGNLYVSGPGGAWIISPDGRHLGTIEAPELPANFAWGGGDGRTLYMTARGGLYRIRLNVPGIRPELRPS
jgi:gluconolactonase